MGGLASRLIQSRRSDPGLSWKSLPTSLPRPNNFIFGLVLNCGEGSKRPTLVAEHFFHRRFYCLIPDHFLSIFENVNLGRYSPLPRFGVILGLALQDTLGNFFGRKILTGRPSISGSDVITVGAQSIRGVVENHLARPSKSGP